MPQRLTTDEIKRYRRDGLLFPIRVLSAAETQQFRRACDALELDLGGKPRTIEVRQMHLHLEWAFALATRRSVLDAVEDVLGPDLLIWATELFTKHPKDTTVSIHWHRDEPYLGLIGGSSATAWIALSPSNPANGCMSALPRSAEQDITGHDNGITARGAELPPGSESSVVQVNLQPGEMSLHAADILHGSGPSQSDEKRVGFVIRYITPDARPIHGQPPVVVASGADRHHHFTNVEPPGANALQPTLLAMRTSAIQHLDVVLENLKRSESEAL